MKIVMELPEHKVELLRHRLQEHTEFCAQSKRPGDWETLASIISRKNSAEREIFSIVKEPLAKQLNGGV